MRTLEGKDCLIVIADCHDVRSTFMHRVIGDDRLDAVRSYHGQAVDRVAPALRVAAAADDGVIEAIEPADPEMHWSILGVQWHPELMIFQRPEHRLIDDLVRRAAAAAPP
jgi:putative glutamine amidotransferase